MKLTIRTQKPFPEERNRSRLVAYDGGTRIVKSKIESQKLPNLLWHPSTNPQVNRMETICLPPTPVIPDSVISSLPRILLPSTKLLSLKETAGRSLWASGKNLKRLVEQQKMPLDVLDYMPNHPIITIRVYGPNGASMEPIIIRASRRGLDVFSWMFPEESYGCDDVEGIKEKLDYDISKMRRLIDEDSDEKEVRIHFVWSVRFCLSHSEIGILRRCSINEACDLYMKERDACGILRDVIYVDIPEVVSQDALEDPDYEPREPTPVYSHDVLEEHVGMTRFIGV